MANEQNLIKNEDLTPKQRRENASKAGKASGEARKRKKTLKEELIILLELEKEGKSNQERMSIALLEKAQKGNTKAFEIIRDTIGEKPKEGLEFNQDKPFEVNINVKRK